MKSFLIITEKQLNDHYIDDAKTPNIIDIIIVITDNSFFYFKNFTGTFIAGKDYPKILLPYHLLRMMI